jgi:hypothetical protein
MKVIKLDSQMLPIVYMVKHWGKLYYIDQAGYMLSVKETKKKIEESNVGA